MSLISHIVLLALSFAHAEAVPGDHILISRTHPHSGPTKVELSCPAAKDANCEARRYVNDKVVSQAAVTRSKSDQIFKDFLTSSAATKTPNGDNSGQFVKWDVAYAAQHTSGAINSEGKLARPVVSLEAELLALVRKR